MNAPLGDNLDFGEGFAAEAGERALPGVIAAFKAAYAADPHQGRDLGQGVSSYDLAVPQARVFYARVKNKVVILLVVRIGIPLSAGQTAYLYQLVTLLKKRSHS